MINTSKKWPYSITLFLEKHINLLLKPNQCLYVFDAFIYKIYFFYIYPKAQAVSNVLSIINLTYLFVAHLCCQSAIDMSSFSVFLRYQDMLTFVKFLYLVRGV